MAHHYALAEIENYSDELLDAYYKWRAAALQKWRGTSNHQHLAWLLADLALVKQEYLRRERELPVPF